MKDELEVINWIKNDRKKNPGLGEEAYAMRASMKRMHFAQQQAGILPNKVVTKEDMAKKRADYNRRMFGESGRNTNVWAGVHQDDRGDKLKTMLGMSRGEAKDTRHFKQVKLF